MAASGPKRVVVVGGGIVGASVAFHLSERGARVTVLDAGEPGDGASLASFAWINARDKNPRAYHDLNRRSLDGWARFERRLGRNIGLVWGGELRWASTAAGAEEIRQRVRTLQAWGYGIRTVDPGEIAEWEPGIRTGPCTLGSFTEGDGHVNAPAVVAACLDDVCARGGEVLRRCPVTGFEPGEGGVVAAVAGGARTPCDVAVVACGPDTPAVGALAGVDVPVYHTFGASVLTGPVRPVFRRVAVVHSPREAAVPLNIRQLPDGRVMVHGGRHGASHDESLGRSDADVARVFEAAARVLPALERTRIEEVRRARRPIPEDGVSIVGFSPRVPNVYVAVTHSGVTLAPLIGELAATEILDGATVDLLEPFRPGRFEEPERRSWTTGTRSAALSEVVR